MTRGDVLALAAWCGLVAGTLEGFAHLIARQFPAVQAPYKSSIAIVWVAPTVNIVVFLSIGLGLALVIRTLRQRVAVQQLNAIVLWILAFGAAVTPLITLKILWAPSAALLSMGAATLATRALRPRIAEVFRAARRLLWMVAVAPVFLGVLGAGSTYALERRASGALGAPQSGAPNVLILILDTVRRDRFAGGRSPMPTLQSFLTGATWFDNAWSTTSWSLPSQASVLTGRYPHEHGGDFPGIAIHPDVPALAESMARGGWVTGAFSGNASWVTPEHLGRGFVRFETFELEHLVSRTVAYRALQPLVIALGRHPGGIGKEAPEISREFLGFLDAYPDRPFFAYLCFMDVNRRMYERQYGHPAWEPDAPVADVVKAYDDALGWLDGEIGRLLRELEQRGALKNTILVVTSDHGESFGAQHAGDHDPDGHGSSLYPEQTRVPLWLRIPGGGASRTESKPVSLRMIAATVAREAGLRDWQLFGEPLPTARDTSTSPANAAPASSASSASPDVLLTLRYDKHVIDAIADERWYYLREPRQKPPQGQLFDLKVDPLARTNRLPDGPGRGSWDRRVDALLRAAPDSAKR